MVALAVVATIRLQLDVWRQLVAAKGFCELFGVKGLFLVGDSGQRVNRGVAEPVAGRRYLAIVDLADVGDELVDTRHSGLLPVPLEHPDAHARLRWHRL